MRSVSSMPVDPVTPRSSVPGEQRARKIAYSNKISAPHAWREMIGCIAPLSVKESNYSVHFTLGFDVYRIDNIVDSYPYIFFIHCCYRKTKSDSNSPLTRKVLAKYRHLTKEPMESSAGRASICLSTGLGSRGLNVSSAAGGFLPVGEVAGCCLFSSLLAFLLVERPFLNLLKDSLSDFLKDFRREIGVSPAPVRSKTDLKVR